MSRFFRYETLFNILPEQVLADYWNRQWKQTIVFWDLGKKGNQNVKDCLKFTSDDERAVILLLGTFGRIPEKDDDKVRFIMKRLQYEYEMSIPVKLGGDYQTDSEGHKSLEYWQTPQETLSSGKGDCDDWGILLYALLRKAGIPSYRLKCAVTKIVKNGKPAGLHFNLISLARKDYEWYVLEGSWYPEIALRRFLSVPRKDSTDIYGEILFTFNEEYSWSQRDLIVKPSFKTGGRKAA